MSEVIVIVVVGAVAAAIHYLILRAGLRRSATILDWLRNHRAAHALFLVVWLVASVTFPFWKEGDEPIDWIVAAGGVLGFGGTLVGVLGRSERYERWVRDR